MIINGYQIIFNPLLSMLGQTKYPRSKKRRIRKKYQKRYLKSRPDTGFYKIDHPSFGKAIVCHPAMKEPLERELAARTRSSKHPGILGLIY